MAEKITKEFFAANTLVVARALLGTRLKYRECEGIIVETEAYRDDEASHAVTRPNKGVLLRQTYGHIYVFFIYGMHHCLNFTTEKNGVGAVLIRAVEPTSGMDFMKKRRRTDDIINTTNGPGKLFQAFGIDPGIHGEEIGQSIQLQRTDDRDFAIGVSSRIGISKASDLQWRFFIEGNPFVSKSWASVRQKT